MNLDRPFDLVTPTLDGDVLRILASADLELTPGQVQRRMGHASVQGIRLVLARLLGQGIVEGRRAGNATVFSLNHDHLAAPYVRGIAQLRAEFAQLLADRFLSWAPSPEFVCLLGTAATPGPPPRTLNMLMSRRIWELHIRSNGGSGWINYRGCAPWCARRPVRSFSCTRRTWSASSPNWTRGVPGWIPLVVRD